MKIKTIKSLNNSEEIAQISTLPKAKLFQNGRSQAVRLPKEYRFEGTEIGVGRVGSAVILYDLNDPWAVFFESAEELSHSNLPPLKRDQTQKKRKFEK